MNPTSAYPNAAAGLVPHRGGLILALGLISLLVCGPVGIVAWVLGHTDLRRMREGAMDPEGRGLTTAGMVCGIIATVLMALGLVVFVISILVIGFAGVVSAAG